MVRLSGERHTGPSLGLTVWRCALQLAKRQTVSSGCQHLLQRLYHLPRTPQGSLSPVSDQLQSPRRGPEQSCRAQNTAKTQSEPSCAAGTFVEAMGATDMFGLVQ
ncbi:hypothetical protein NQZ68_023874 [Dissostichus eleginoides]|nr:hypothetical protein NQZ68_023874 [Dissostichus eleginoides]